MNGKRLVYALLAALITYTSLNQPVALAKQPYTAINTETTTRPGAFFFETPDSIPGPLSGPKPTINSDVSHGYVGQEINITGAVPSASYNKVRISWLFNDSTYTAALVQRDANLQYSAKLTIPLTNASGQAKLCAALTNEPAAEFACTTFNLDPPPAGGVSGILPSGGLLAQQGRGQTTRAINAPSTPPAVISLSDHAGSVVYSSTVAMDGSFTIADVTPGLYGYSFTGGVTPGLSSGILAVEPGKVSPLTPSLASKGFDPVTHLACLSNFDAQVGWTKTSTSDETFGYYGEYSELSSFKSLMDSMLASTTEIAGRDYDFGVYLKGVSLPLTFRASLQVGSGVTVDRVEYHVQQPDHSIVSLGSSSDSDFYKLTYDIKDLPSGRSKLIVAPVVGGVRQCPKTYTIEIDPDPMKDPLVQTGAVTTWNSAKKWYDFQGTLINAGGLLPFMYPKPKPDLPLLGKVENSFSAGLHLEGEIRLNGVVHIKIMRVSARAVVFNDPILDKNQELVDDSKEHLYTHLHDWQGQTKVKFEPVDLVDIDLYTPVYKGPLASFWGVVTVNASLSVGIGGKVAIEGTIYPFIPRLDATLRNTVTPHMSVSIWVDLLLGVASAGADGNVAMSFYMPLRLDTGTPEARHDPLVWMDTPCFSVKITLSAWARVDLLVWKKKWNIGSYELVNYSNPSGCTALAKAVKQVAPEAQLRPPRVMAAPAVASSVSGELLSAYIVDATPAVTQTTPMVMASFFDSGGQSWQTPMAVSDGLHNVQDPAVAFIGQSQNPIVIWTQTDLTLAQENLTGDDINSYLNKQEIYYALWNSNTNNWDAPVRLTSDALPDGRAAISGDPSGATLAWVVNTSGVVTQTTSLRINVTDWDQQNNQWGTTRQLNGKDPNPSMNAQVSVARFSGIAALAWTVDTDGDISTNGDRSILACREAAINWGAVSCDNMGAQPGGGESPSLTIDPMTDLLHMAFIVRGKDADGLSDTGIGNQATLVTGQADGNTPALWSYQALTDQGSPVFAEKPTLLINNNGDESLLFRRFGAAGTNGMLGQLALAHMPYGGSFFSIPNYLTDDNSQHYQQAAAINPGLPAAQVMVLSVNRAAIQPSLASDLAQTPQLAPAASFSTSRQTIRLQKDVADSVEWLALNNQADLALALHPQISAQHALPGAQVAITVTLRNLGLGPAYSNNPPIEVCLYNGTPPNGSQLDCQDLPPNDTLNYNDETQLVFISTRANGQQPLFARVTSNGYNGAPGNDIALAALGNIPAPLLTGVFEDGSLENSLGVQWMPPGVPGLGGYRLLRSTNSGGPYELVGETTNTYLPDLLLSRGQTYCYVVQTFDDSGVISPNSSEACGMLPLLNIFLPVVRR